MSVFKTQEEATATMLQYFIAASGIEIDTENGGIEKTLMQAVGFEIEQQSYEVDSAIRNAITRIGAQLLGLEEEKERAALTTLRFGRSALADEGYLIPAGTTASTPSGMSYETTQEVILPVGALYVDAPAVATLPGSAGNTAPDTITLMNSLILGIETVTNPTPAEGGRDAEAEEERLAKISRGFAKLARGTLQAIEATALDFSLPSGERATQVLAVDHFLDPDVPGFTVKLYVYRPGGVSEALKTGILQHMNANQQRGAGILLEVIAVPEVTVDLTALVRAPSSSALSMVEAAARTFFDAHRVGEDFILDRLIAALGSAEGVYSVHVSSPSSNITIPRYTKAVLGTVTLSYQSGGPA
ncbi:baseplate J/gp47 family protein [Deinococcus cellulosilyticus]|uniref:Uncharacterized protein n=1 Tax=Deinococcus cellulosilyticus (strain DSM 18568 / NBRC 106333 / KACC 11606 / 5516J-15) TaxID=1223518 RepID=A0A511N741_DEIC1|nr:baseplate J/gp47 family protein [Deinococcus cellulosilyticus]GEM48669.1 hypothetical protein DC3_43040 [Deinococcus cellulosilyticus NBRC 106333 = KACC 11606]